MKSLEELTQEDNTLRRLVSETQGSIKHQIQIIVDSEVSLRFKRLYEDYVLLYREAGILEGLKRSLFFQWYAAVEPPFLTGFFFGPPVRHLYGSLSTNSNLCIIKTRFIGRIIRTRSRTTNNATLLLPYCRLLFHILFHTKSTFISPRNIQLPARQYFKSIDVGSRKNGRILEKYSARDFA